MFSKAVRGVFAVLGALGILAYFNSRKKQVEPGAGPGQAAAGPETSPAEQELTEEQAAEIVSTWTTLNPP
jgi:hypothetical protein